MSGKRSLAEDQLEAWGPLHRLAFIIVSSQRDSGVLLSQSPHPPPCSTSTSWTSAAPSLRQGESNATGTFLQL